MAKDVTDEKIKNDSDGISSQKICGIVMPIASMGEDYSEEHWRRVKKVIQRAIDRAGMNPQVVWDNAEIDVIQSAILKNIYENDVVVCDLSGLNPNVMLETGLRLSTKRPTVIITDRIVKPPFDITTMGYIEYQKDLEYNSTEEFINKLSQKIRSVQEAYGRNQYKSFVEQFTFETVTPSTVNVSSEEFLRDQLANLALSIRRIEFNQRRSISQSPASLRDRSPPNRNINIVADVTPEVAARLEAEIDCLEGLDFCAVRRTEDGKYRFVIPLLEDGGLSRASALEVLKPIFQKGEDDSLPF